MTGNGWVFPILKASASVILPSDILKNKIRTEGYTGPKGSKEQNYTSRVDSSGHAIFTSTAKLPPYCGLTIVVSWPKKITKSITPSASAKRSYVGTWRNLDSAMVIVLNADGTGSTMGHRLRWKEQRNDRIVITDEQGHSIPARLGSDRKSLTIDPDGSPGILIRQ